MTSRSSTNIDSKASATPAWDVSLIGFGLPSDPRTFSGYAANLLHGLREKGHLRREFSSKSLRSADVLRGAFTPRSVLAGATFFCLTPLDVGAIGQCHAFGSAQPIHRRVGRPGPVSGGETPVRIDPRLGPQYQLTDITIAQARRTGQFAVGRLSASFIAGAEQLQQEILASARHVFTLSEWTAASVRMTCGVPEERVTVVYAGSNLQVPAHLTASRRQREILFVGMDWERKGGPILLEAFRSVRRAFPDATLRVVGCVGA